MQGCLTELRPMMIPLVELKTDEISDFSYLSSIGNKYGDIYERQLECAMNSKLNHPNIPEWYNQEVKPCLGREKLWTINLLRSNTN